MFRVNQSQHPVFAAYPMFCFVGNLWLPQILESQNLRMGLRMKAET